MDGHQSARVSSPGSRTPVGAWERPATETIYLSEWTANTRSARARLERSLKLYRFLKREQEASERNPGRKPKPFPKSYGPGTLI